MRTPDQTFDRAAEIYRERMTTHSGDLYAALLSLVGPVHVADRLVGEFGSTELALLKACYEAAERETAG